MDRPEPERCPCCGQRLPNPTGDRAERLDALLALYRGGHDNPREFMDELPLDEADSLARATDDDMHLANACLAVEAELHGREFAAAERLLARGVFAADDAGERLRVMPPAERGQAAQDLIDLGLVPGLH